MPESAAIRLPLPRYCRVQSEVAISSGVNTRAGSRWPGGAFLPAGYLFPPGANLCRWLPVSSNEGGGGRSIPGHRC